MDFFTIIVIIILILLIIHFIKTGFILVKLNNMKKDIQILNDKIAIYYLNNGSLPIKDKVEFKDNSINPNDNENYYEIDLNKIENLYINLGHSEKENEDIYIINEQSHTIYYYAGIKYKNKIYYVPKANYTKIVLENYE